MTNHLNASAAIDTRAFHPYMQYEALRASLSLMKVQEFIEAHRRVGYRAANLEPLGGNPAVDMPELTPEFYGLDDMNIALSDIVLLDIALSDIDVPLNVTTIEQLDQRLKKLYCGAIGLDTSSMRDASRRQWLIARMERELLAPPPSQEQAASNHRRLTHAEQWERNVQRAYPKAKRFSLEGCESLLPLMDTLVDMAGRHGIGKLFLGMPHRGRLNLLVNLMDVPAGDILQHFDTGTDTGKPEYDLPYHLGCSTVRQTPNGPVALFLAHNPSHLQSVYPVVLGMARACQDEQRLPESRCVPVMIHGDAAFSGQGVVMESLKLAQYSGYTVQGTVHIIVNNQIGFTTPNPLNIHAHVYCTDISRIVDAPVLHVNADHPEAVVQAARIAFDYRMKFGADILIDLIGYRRWGHAEQDTAEITQPQLHDRIDRHPSITTLHRQSAAAGVSDADIALWQAEALALFERKNPQPKDGAPLLAPVQAPTHAQAGPVSLERLQQLVTQMTTLPAQFNAHPIIGKLAEKWRLAVTREDHAVDWCFAENMAYASLLASGHGVRISGMDVGRGTFMHRHAVWHSQQAAGAAAAAGKAADPAVRPSEFVPLRQVVAGQAAFDIYNSPLTEEAVLGFEYGYSVETVKHRLVIWEAQFGDFVNGAQIMVDQYISAGEEKWGYRSALTMLLPHGYEGVGPEHSSAYLSRFLQLCADRNIRVAYPSNSAQWFHLLREQALAEERKPLVVIAPKGTLYSNQRSFSPLAKLIDGRFLAVLPDPDAISAEAVTRVVLSSGKLFYDLQAGRETTGVGTTALIRIERLYPFPADELATELAKYSNLVEVVWAQEEDKNQGAWQFFREHQEDVIPAGVSLRCVCRTATAAGARASTRQHLAGQLLLVASALS